MASTKNLWERAARRRRSVHERLEPRCLLAANLVADMSLVNRGSDPSHVTAVGELVYFVANDGTHGEALWRSDGTESGTWLTGDATPGSPVDGDIFRVAAAGDRVFFDALVAGNDQLWVTDGSPNGAGALRLPAGGLEPGPTVADVSGVLYFVQRTSIYSSDETLWKSDGTVAGTLPLVDFRRINALANLNGTLYFAANDGSSGMELWRSDGTTTGTTLVADINPGPGGSNPYEFVNAAGVLYFQAYEPEHGTEFWRSNGSGVGTQLVRDLVPGPLGSLPEQFTPLGAGYAFVAGDELWLTDGSEAGTTNLDPSAPWGPDPRRLTEAGGLLYFSSNGLSSELWRTDGTPGGTFPLRPNFPQGRVVDRMANLGGVLYFSSQDSFDDGLWRSDGSVAGTYLFADVQDDNEYYPLRHLTTAADQLFFTANGGLTGIELWATDGTFQGTGEVKNVRGGSDGSDPRALTQVGPASYFVGTDAQGRLALWRTDGTTDGTTIVFDGASAFTYYGELAALGDRLVFSASQPDVGQELFVSDGTAAGTFVINLLGGSTGSQPRALTVIDGVLFFSARTGPGSEELWRSDGTPGGTFRISNIFPSGNARVDNLTAVGSTLYFTAKASSSDVEPWMSDGTMDGTVRVADLRPGAQGSYPRSLTNVAGTLFFVADVGSGPGLYRSDGTGPNTTLVRGFPAPIGEEPRQLTAVDDRLFFRAYTSAEGVELWTSDGTPAGTTLVADLRSGTAGPSFSSFVAWNGKLYFGARLSTAGSRSLWESDGTEDGTKRVSELPSLTGELLPLEDSLYFVALDATTGVELWKTDGTEAGTQLVDDIFAGFNSSNPKQLRAINRTLYFTATDDRGAELWSVRQPGDANADGVAGGADFTIWSDNFGRTNATIDEGDFNDDGRVTGADFTIWSDNFDFGVPAMLAARPVVRARPTSTVSDAEVRGARAADRQLAVQWALSHAFAELGMSHDTRWRDGASATTRSSVLRAAVPLTAGKTRCLAPE